MSKDFGVETGRPARPPLTAPARRRSGLCASAMSAGSSAGGFGAAPAPWLPSPAANACHASNHASGSSTRSSPSAIDRVASSASLRRSEDESARRSCGAADILIEGGLENKIVCGARLFRGQVAQTTPMAFAAKMMDVT